MQKKEILKKWQVNHRYLKKVVEVMPTEDFDYKPVDNVKTFKAQMSHIASWLRSHSRFVTDTEMPKHKAKPKEEFINALDEFFVFFLEKIEEMKEQDFAEIVDVWYGASSKFRILAVMDNHLTHHRAQMILYLRLKGLKPPSYVGW